MKILVAGYRIAAAFALCCTGLMLFGLLPVANAQTITISADVDAWVTDPGSEVDLPGIPAGFFGPGSDPFVGIPGFDLTSHPFPDQFGFPIPFPADELNLSVQFVDPHGNAVGPDSKHAVGAKVQDIGALVPFNFDTVVRRAGPAVFTGVGQTQQVPIEMVWLSLKSVAPITVTFGGGSDPTPFDVYVGLSGAAPQTTGRMLLESTAFGGGSVSGTIDMGEVGDQVDQQFQNVNQSTPNPFMAYQSFFGNPNALGLPVTYQLRFVEQGSPSNVFGFENPVGDTAFGGAATRTVSVFHNTSGKFSYGGDFNFDGFVDAADYIVWRKGMSPFPNSQSDYIMWRANFGRMFGSGAGVGVGGSGNASTAVPEPAGALLMMLAPAIVFWRTRRIALRVPLTR